MVREKLDCRAALYSEVVLKHVIMEMNGDKKIRLW